MNQKAEVDDIETLWLSESYLVNEIDKLTTLDSIHVQIIKLSWLISDANILNYLHLVRRLDEAETDLFYCKSLWVGETCSQWDGRAGGTDYYGEYNNVVLRMVLADGAFMCFQLFWTILNFYVTVHCLTLFVKLWIRF